MGLGKLLPPISFNWISSHTCKCSQIFRSYVFHRIIYYLIYKAKGREHYLRSPSIRPSSVGTPTRIALSRSGSSWLDFRVKKISAVACRLLDHTIRRRGKWRTNRDNFDTMFVGTISSPTSFADCMKNPISQILKFSCVPRHLFAKHIVNHYPETMTSRNN